MPFPRFACFAGRSVRSLEHALNMNAGNFPGEVAKRIDADVLAFEANKVTEASVVTTGTNGKTTTNNLIASCMERAGHDVFCNRAGSNLEAGIITALLDTRTAPYALLECDEMYSAPSRPSSSRRSSTSSTSSRATRSTALGPWTASTTPSRRRSTTCPQRR